MKLHQAQRELSAIRRRLRSGKRQINAEQLHRYAETGQLPDDELTRSYVELTESARACMVTSIGGDQDVHERACDQYQKALDAWQQMMAGGAI